MGCLLVVLWIFQAAAQTTQAEDAEDAAVRQPYRWSKLVFEQREESEPGKIRRLLDEGEVYVVARVNMTLSQKVGVTSGVVRKVAATEL